MSKKVIEMIGPFEIVEVEGGYKVPSAYNEGPTHKTLERARQVAQIAAKAFHDYSTGKREMPSVFNGE